VDGSYAAGGVAGLATDSLRFNLLGSYEEGDDTAFPGGTIRDTAFERGLYGFSSGARFGAHEVGLDYRRQTTGPTGNPSFAMDIRYFDSDHLHADYSGEFETTRIEAGVGYVDIAHGMNNFDLRPPPAAAMRRETFADAITRTGDLTVIFPVAEGELRLGADVEDVDRANLITNPTNPNFYIRSMPDVSVRRAGLFAEWAGAIGSLNGELGIRVDQTDAEAGLAETGPAVPAMIAGLAASFNAEDRSRDETTFDGAARIWTAPINGLVWRATLAHKTRAPSYLERFAWLPTEASAGLADGNIYVGDLDLSPETAWTAEVGVDYETERWSIRPSIYIREIDDYIQGVPFDATPGVLDTPQEMVASMNGDTTPLRFANVDARLYGFDLDASLKLSDSWRLDGVASYVRGERRDIDDNLYRIAPPSLTVSATYEASVWDATLEARAVAKQTEVSSTNSEAPTSGYVILNLLGGWDVARGVRLSASVENLLDHQYRDHLAGYNRVSGSEVALGQRLPGPGRSFLLRLNVSG
jgi:iron complex outermembrane receptor protein